MRFGVAKLFRISRASFPIRKRGFVLTGVFLPGSSRSHGKKLHNGDEHVPAPLPRMRQDLGQPTAKYLRRVFLATRNYLRLRFTALARFARPVRLARAEHLALSRIAAAAGWISAVAAGGIHAAGKRSAAGRKDWIAAAVG